MDIQAGDRVTYEISNGVGGKIRRITIITEDNEAFTNDTKIIKIERPKYEVVEEKKELLTEEEKEYLKNIIKPLKYKSLTIKKSSDNYIKILIYTENDDCCDTLSLPYIKNFKNLKFENLEESKDYNIEELGLEEK